jgi:hypothetical protein
MEQHQDISTFSNCSGGTKHFFKNLQKNIQIPWQ